MVEHRPLNDIIAYAILTLGIFIVAFPVYLAFIASTHDAATVVGGHMPLTPGSHTLDNYYRAIFVGGSRTSREPVGHMLMNSFISAIGIALGKIFISILSAYAVVYFRFPFRKTAFWIIFVTLMLPVEVRIYPTYKVVADLKMLDTYAGLILPLIASATGTLLFRQFFMTIPEELLEASRIDGAGPMRRFWTITFPLLSPTTFFLLVVNIVYVFFDTFGIIDAVTGGGPAGATTTMVYKVFADGRLGGDLGGSAAQSVVLMVIVIALTAVQFKYVERKVQY